MRDAYDLEVSSASPACVAALDATREAYLGFRIDAA